jgi:16S rRNA (cytosine1402-N4)-methyltransferase
MAHIPVLLKEVLEFANLRSGDYFIDATIGNGGHAQAILQQISPHGKLLGIDWNQDAIMKLKRKFKKEIARGILMVEVANFSHIVEIVKRKKFPNPNGILADLGMSSEELEESGRGFSFKRDEPLLMTYDANPPPQALTAEKIVNTFSEKELIEIFLKFGEERFAKRYARAIISNRPIRTSLQLAKIIVRHSPRSSHRLHPATRVFQALRIAVNNELENLQTLINDGFNILKPEGRMLIISYHSLEDRIVKFEFRKRVATNSARLITKKPIRPSAEEIRRNPRARSAKLRVLQKL